MVSNPENFLDMVKITIFERSQVFQKDYSNDFKKVLGGCKFDYLTLLESHGIDSDSIEFKSIKKVWDKIFNILTSSLSGRRSTAYTQLKNLLNGLFSEDLIYTHNKDTALYRMRICSLRKNIPHPI